LHGCVYRVIRWKDRSHGRHDGFAGGEGGVEGGGHHSDDKWRRQTGRTGISKPLEDFRAQGKSAGAASERRVGAVGDEGQQYIIDSSHIFFRSEVFRMPPISFPPSAGTYTGYIMR